MVWVVVHGILINFYVLMWKFCTLLVIFFGRIADFINFEADDDDRYVIIDDCDPEAQTVGDNEFIDDETHIDNNFEDYYAINNVCRSVKDAIQDSFLDSDSSGPLLQHEVNIYCHDNYDPSSEQSNEFRDSAKRIEEFKHTLLYPHCLEN